MLACKGKVEASSQPTLFRSSWRSWSPLSAYDGSEELFPRTQGSPVHNSIPALDSDSSKGDRFPLLEYEVQLANIFYMRAKP